MFLSYAWGQHLVQQSHSIALHAFDYMRISVHCKGYRAMPQGLADNLGLCPAQQHEAGKGMP